MPFSDIRLWVFSGRRLGWLEDLPAGVALEWSFHRSCFERSHPLPDRQSALDRMAAVTAPILAVIVYDDDLGTPAAMRRTLGYYSSAERIAVELRPLDFGRSAIGHFGLFTTAMPQAFGWTPCYGFATGGIHGPITLSILKWETYMHHCFICTGPARSLFKSFGRSSVNDTKRGALCMTRGGCDIRPL